jgi:hypothetical protein
VPAEDRFKHFRERGYRTCRSMALGTVQNTVRALFVGWVGKPLYGSLAVWFTGW